MKKLIVSLSLFFACFIFLSAQNSGFTTVNLVNGATLRAQVEKQAYGGYKLTTEDGSVFYFNENEIKSFGQASIQPERELKYWELKQMYSAKDYHGRELGDKYSPAGVGIASFLIPGLGQYITGTNVGIGVMQTVLGLASFAGVVFHARDMYYTGEERLKDLHRKYTDATIASASIWAGIATWSCCSAVKAAKIKNLYYRDVRNGVAFKFDVAPYFDVTSPMLASNTGVVSGLSLKISF